VPKETSLDQFVALATSMEQEQSESAIPRNIAANTSLMWRILDFAAPHRSTRQHSDLFQSSFRETILSRASSHFQTAFDEPEVHSPPGDLQDSTGDYAAPPDWFSPLNSTSPSAVRQTLENDSASRLLSVPPQRQAQSATFPDVQDTSISVWGATEFDVAYAPWTHFYNRPGPETGWWDFGNL
jgi:hypothetical protein